MKNNRGLAMLEALPIIMLMFVLMGATLGSWGIVHTAILNSIAARNFTFFYFNNRSDLSYLRDFAGPDGYGLFDNITDKYFRKDGQGTNDGMGKRFFYIWAENTPEDAQGVMPATLRRVDFRNLRTASDDESNILSDGAHSTVDNINPGEATKMEAGKAEGEKRKAWIMVGYGICLDANCGDN